MRTIDSNLLASVTGGIDWWAAQKAGLTGGASGAAAGLVGGPAGALAGFGTGYAGGFATSVASQALNPPAAQPTDSIRM